MTGTLLLDNAEIVRLTLRLPEMCRTYEAWESLANGEEPAETPDASYWMGLWASPPHHWSCGPGYDESPARETVTGGTLLDALRAAERQEERWKADIVEWRREIAEEAKDG